MANRRHNGWFEVRPRYSAGSPAMVDMDTALSVARQEARAYPAYIEGTYAAEGVTTAQTLGLRGIVEWKMEAGMPGQLLAYDLLTRTWHLYNAIDVTGKYERGNHLRYTRPAGFNVAPARVEVIKLAARKYRVDDMTSEQPAGLLPLMFGVPESEVRDFLSWGVYRKAAPERAQHAYQDIQHQLDKALEDAGVMANATR